MKIRQAVKEDLKEILDLHYRSFSIDDHVPMILGKNYVKATYRWLINSKQSYVLVADIDKSIVGLVAVSDGLFTRPMFIACLPDFFLSLVLKPQRVFSARLWKRFMRRPKLSEKKLPLKNEPGFAQMTIGAVDQKYRGAGIFGQLVEATKEVSRARGSKAIRAGIYATNSSSRKVFMKAGWQEMEDLQTEDTVFYATFFEDDFKSKYLSGK
jgi:GNAT superfamily N-acetyltransferase